MPKAVIAGGGIAGLAAGLGLARSGWEVLLCERRAALGDLGAGLQMSPNAARVLDWLGILPEVTAQAFRPRAAVLRDGHTGTEIYRAALGTQAEARWGAPYLHVHRADLHKALNEAARHAGVQIRMNAPAARVASRTDGTALHLEDGEVIEADMVIGADGIRSALRGTMLEAEAPRFTGQVAWRGLVPAERLADNTIGPDATVWAGPGQHLVTYYVRGGTLINFVGVLETEDWAEENWSAPGDTARLRETFAGWHPSVTALLEQVDDCFLWGLFDRPEQVRWVRDRLVLIGDAAHPMLPFMAQGAAQALEDVAALVRHLEGRPASHSEGRPEGQIAGGDIPRALAAWENERWPRVTRVLQTAQANGAMFHRRPGPVRALSRALVSTVSRLAPGLAVRQLDWLYGFDPVRGPT